MKSSSLQITATGRVVVAAQSPKSATTGRFVVAAQFPRRETTGRVVVSAHQPNFLPYLGFFDKMKKSDIFVIRDEVLFIRREYHNRNRIRINSHDNANSPAYKWINVPTNDPNDYIKHVHIKTGAMQKNRHWKKSLLHDLRSNYSHTPFFKEFYPELESIFENSNDNLLELNMNIIKFLCRAFGISVPIVLASTLKLKSEYYKKSDASKDIADICEAVGANVYLSGAGGKDYLNLEPFKNSGIAVEFQEFKHPVYEQALPGFIPNMSAIDALFCAGPSILNYQRVLEPLEIKY